MVKRLFLFLTLSIATSTLFAAQSAQVPAPGAQEATVQLRLADNTIIEFPKKYVNELITLKDLRRDLPDATEAIPLPAFATTESIDDLKAVIGKKTQEDFLSFAYGLELLRLTRLVLIADFLSLNPYEGGGDLAFDRLDLLYTLLAQKITIPGFKAMEKNDQEALRHINENRTIRDKVAQKIMSTWYLIHTLQNSMVYNAQFNYDSTQVVTASQDKTAKIWDAQSGSCLQTLQHGKQVRDAQFSPDGKLVVTASNDKAARIWDALSGRFYTFLQDNKIVVRAQFSPDGSLVITASEGAAKIWDARDGTCLRTLQHTQPVINAQFSPDGLFIVTASGDNTAKVWNAQTGALVRTLNHEGPVINAQFSPDGLFIVTASQDKTARIWDAQSGSCLQTLQHNHWVYNAQFSPDGKLIVTVCSDNTAKIWDAQSGSCLQTLQHHKQVNNAHFSPNGNLVVTAANDSVKIWVNPYTFAQDKECTMFELLDLYQWIVVEKQSPDTWKYRSIFEKGEMSAHA